MTEPEFLQHPFRRRDGIASGLTARQVNGSRFRLVTKDVHLAVEAKLDLPMRCAAFQLAIDSPLVFSHFTAAELYDVPIARDPKVHISLCSQIEPRMRGLVAHRVLHLGDVWTLGDLPVTSPGRTFVDLASKLDLLSLVIAGDVLSSRSSLSEIERALRTGSGRRGIRLAREARTLLNPASKSAMETRLRLILVIGGVPSLAVNRPAVGRDGRTFATPDLGEHVVLVGLEYEGEHHQSDPRQWERDIKRDAAYRDNGWHLIKVTKRDIFERPDWIVNEVATALRARGLR
ncbi:hypothetical protein [Sporichthya sp.]|uniref:hypothetical protein n=1 Tax=Sporichthya sp. TaxID=65475 RepID=UPI0017A47596|nr:hypothetical protein [Sporichthya sp.]MBA3743368.1 hypothetical protein [Sporichthya sp.]